MAQNFFKKNEKYPCVWKNEVVSYLIHDSLPAPPNAAAAAAPAAENHALIVYAETYTFCQIWKLLIKF